MVEWLSKVWTLVVEARPDVIGAILGGVGGAIIGVVGAIVGGWVGGRIGAAGAVDAAMSGARQAHEDNVRRDQAARLAQTVAVVQAIRSELGVAWHQAQTIFAPAIKQIDLNKPLHARFVLEGAVFPVYEANAAMLGGIADADVRDVIIRSYAEARSFVDTLRQNNRLVEEYENVESPDLPGGVLKRYVAWETLETFSGGVVSSYNNLEARYGEFVARTDAWLAKVTPP